MVNSLFTGLVEACARLTASLQALAF